MKLPEELLPGSAEAADLYLQDRGANLTRESVFGTNPFQSPEEQQNAEERFTTVYSDMEGLFDSAVNQQPRPFQEAVMELISVSRRQHV